MQKRITLKPLQKDDRDKFIKDNQIAFNYGALEEFGLRDNHFEEDGEIISKMTIENAISEGTAYRIYLNERPVGGVVIRTAGRKGDLLLLFINPNEHSKGIGQKAWRIIEEMHPDVTTWETFTPHFETRNIHFYVNKCGFKIVEFFNHFHPFSDTYRHDNTDCTDANNQLDGMLRFEKTKN